MMSTKFRRRQCRNRHDPAFEDLTLAFVSGFWTAAICATVLVVLWR